MIKSDNLAINVLQQLHGNPELATVCTKSANAKAPEPPKTKAQLLFQGQNHPKKQKKIIRLEQWVEVTRRSGIVKTTLYPSNQKLIQRGQAMLPPPEYVYRRINFPNGVPDEYAWVGIIDETHRHLGGCGVQRMTVDTWLDVIEREARRKDGHIGPTGVGNLPRPQATGGCNCEVCTANAESQTAPSADGTK